MGQNGSWKAEIQEALRRENWSLHGPNRVVKVVQRLPTGARPLRLPAGVTRSASMGGYITQAKFLLGRTPRQIESDLGLPSGYLAHGAMIYRFLRLPMQHEYDYELTTAYPGGLAFNPAHSSPDYAPGSPRIHQWAIKDGAQIPVDASRVIELGPNDRFPYGD